MAKSSSTNSRMESDDDDEAPEVLGGEAVDASVRASISCAKQRTVRPKALPYPTTVKEIIGSYQKLLREQCAAAYPTRKVLLVVK